jgi:hypothetical protein
MISYAQNREDVLLNRFFHGDAPQVYVDVGAATLVQRRWCSDVGAATLVQGTPYFIPLPNISAILVGAV